MKILNLVLLAFLLTSGVAAQTSPSYPDAPGVVVVKNSWHTRVLDSAAYEDPLRASRERVGEEIAQREIMEDYRSSGGSTRTLPSRDVQWRSLRAPTRAVQYIFEAEIKNTGAKRMRGVVWEYVFLGPAGGREVGYRRFASKVSVSPGKSAKMVAYITLHVNNATEAKVANKAAQQAHGKYLERISIRRILYEDNSVWERHSKEADGSIRTQ